MHALVLLVASLCQDQPGPPQKKPDVEAQVTGCFGVNEVLGVHANTYILDARNNTHEDLELILHIEGATALSRKVELPRLTRQRYFLYVLVPPGSTSGYATWHLTDDRGRPMGPRDNTVHASLIGDPERGLKVLILSEETMGAGRFDLPTRYKENRVDAVECRPRNLPDSWIGLKGFDFIVLYNYPVSELSPRQLQALQDWVIAGGRLVTIATVDPTYLQSDAIAKFYTFPIPGPRFVHTHADLEAFPEAVLPSPEPFPFYEIPGGSRLHGAPGKPLFVEQGRGRAYLIPFDAMRKPFGNNRDFKNRLWSEIFDHATQTPSMDDTISLRPEDIPGLTQLVIPPPPVGTVILILAAFVVLVGPANYAFLFRRGRPLLSVVTIPAISILFALIIIAIGLFFRAGQPAANNVVLLQANSGSPYAFETRILTLFSTRHATYDFEFRRGTYLLLPETIDPDTDYGWRAVDVHDYRPRLEQLEDGFAVRSLGLARFAGTMFQCESVRPLGGSVDLQVADGQALVANRSEHRIVRAAYLERTGSACLFEAIGQGRSIQAEIKAEVGTQMAIDHLSGGDPVLREIVSAAMRDRPDALYALLEKDLGHVSIDGKAETGIRTIVLLRVPR